MAAFLVAYGTSEGQTASIADRIAATLEARGHQARTVSVIDPSEDLEVGGFDAVVVGASIHVGRHQPEVVSFVDRHRSALAERPTAFFQVSMSSATDEGEERAASYVEAFLENTGWNPDRIGLFGGALRFSEYGFVKRLFMKQLARRTLPDVETGQDVEFTDWTEVEAFANDVAAFAEGRLGVSPPPTEDG